MRTLLQSVHADPGRRPFVKALLRNLPPAVAVLLLMQLVLAQVPSFTPFSADMQMSKTHGPQDTTGQIFVGSGHLRMNLTSAGHESAIITDFATKTTDILMLPQQMYME